jgi:cell division septum initiation protein DivIVA
LTAEVEKMKHEPTDVATLRRQVADYRLEVSHLKTQMIRITEPLERKIKGLEKELEHSKVMRRDLENKLRRQQNEADSTFAAPISRPAAADKTCGTANSSTHLPISAVSKQQPLDHTSLGTVGHMLLARADAEIGAIKRQVSDQIQKIGELKQANDQRLKSDNTDMQARLSRKVDRESRSVLSPRLDQSLLARSTPSLTNSRLNTEAEPRSPAGVGGTDPAKCRLM